MDRTMLNDATSADDSPTPGYMLNEISSNIFIIFIHALISCLIVVLFIYNCVGSTLANYSACLQLEEYLCSKLAKNNHNIKFKCLLIIKVRYGVMHVIEVYFIYYCVSICY